MPQRRPDNIPNCGSALTAIACRRTGHQPGTNAQRPRTLYLTAIILQVSPTQPKMSSEIGTLVVVVLKARNLLDKHSLFKQDVYTKVTLNGVTKQTEIDVKGGQHPEWDQELRFSVTESTKKKARTLELSCWSKEPRNDDLVGKGELNISETLDTGEFDGAYISVVHVATVVMQFFVADWIPLTTSTDVQRGDLYLEMTYYANGPPPAISRRPSKLDPATRLSRVPAGGKPSQQYLHAGLQAVLSSEENSLLAPPSSLQSGRPSVSDRKSTRLNSSHSGESRMPSSA